MQSYIFYQAFLYFTVRYNRNTLINFDFLIKEDFWYVVLILDLIGLNVLLLSFVLKNSAWSKKFT